MLNVGVVLSEGGELNATAMILATALGLELFLEKATPRAIAEQMMQTSALRPFVPTI